jgi:hypothetical protein
MFYYEGAVTPETRIISVNQLFLLQNDPTPDHFESISSNNDIDYFSLHENHLFRWLSGKPFLGLLR